MAATTFKSGPLTRDEILALWRDSVVDKSYGDPLVAAGEGNGLEVYTQQFEQFARVSRAIDVATEAMYALPWSGQTSPPAQGEAKATVTLSFTRTKLLDHPLVVGAGTVFIEEETEDFGEQGAETVTTGRRYTLLANLVLLPGETGPKSGVAVAERPGWGYNNPFPGTIRRPSQPGTGFTNTSARVASTSSVSSTVPLFDRDTRLVVRNVPDVVVPQHVGQYVLVNDGSNVNVPVRMVAYHPANPSADDGGEVTLELVIGMEAHAGNFAGTFIPGEVVEVRDGVALVAVGYLMAEQVVGANKRIVVGLTALPNPTGVMPAFTDFLGLKSGATSTKDLLLVSDVPVDATGTTWRVLDWEDDWGLSVTNALSPTGGRLGILDALGKERRIARSPGESDAAYAKRITTVADVVSPNALRRAANRILVPLGYTGFLREVGSRFLPGMYCDAGASTDASPLASNDYAWDMDTVLFAGGADVGTFLDGEPVVHAATGARGYAVLTRPVPGVVPGPAPATSLAGVVRSEGPVDFSAGTVTGLISGATRVVGVVTLPTFNPHRYKLWLDFTEMRAFFLMEVPRLDTGDFGFPYDTSSGDAHPWINAYDLTSGDPSTTAYDGWALTAARTYRAIWQALYEAHGAGVGFELVQPAPTLPPP